MLSKCPINVGFIAQFELVFLPLQKVFLDTFLVIRPVDSHRAYSALGVIDGSSRSTARAFC